MAHDKNSKTEKICFRIKPEVRELLDLLVEKTGKNKTEIARDFFLLGIDEALVSHLNRDLKHWELGFSYIKKITEGRLLDSRISDVIQINKFKEVNT